jgi:bisanhydrobacterioruberin hydratase
MLWISDLNKYTRVQIATTIAIIFHMVGLIGILFFKSDLIIASTPINLLLMFGLIVYTQNTRNTSFYLFILFCFVIGICIEIIGTHTGILFGNYAYGNTLGAKVLNVPIVIGINWFVVMFCCGIAMHLMMYTLVKKIDADEVIKKPILKTISVIVDGATLALIFDWLMEPVAIHLGYWSWGGTGEIPIFNYACWFIFSMLFLLVFHFCTFDKQNKFALHLLLIQIMFFSLLRTFL